MKAEKNLQYPVVGSITRRWSPRAFTDKKIPKAEIKSLFEAARWAASARNQQPWLFIWATREQADIYPQVFDCLNDWNQSWAKTADLLIITFARTLTDDKKHPITSAMYDLGLAMGNMTAQASESGIYLHHCGGIEIAKIKQHFQVPEHYMPVTMIAAGYPGNPESIPADIAQNEYNEQIRNEQDEFVFNGIPVWK